MFRSLLFLVVLKGINNQYQDWQDLLDQATPAPLVGDRQKNVEDMEEVAVFGDAEHRGPEWYSSRSSDTEYEIDSEVTSSDPDSDISGQHSTDDSSSEASSQETRERHLETRAYRECTPCPNDMMKKYTNKGIKWICGGYQRARRTFKSECMMRYRNCQDGTLFVKYFDHRCKNDSYHGRHWFYIYKT